MSGPTDEFDWIASLRPLTRGDPRALDLADDAAVLPGRAGFDLVVSQDAMVAGVHFLAGDAPGAVARRLLRTSLSDLAAKAAEPFGYLLTTAWPAALDGEWREAFRAGLAADGEAFAIALLGGDTVSTAGPLTLAATVLGWVPQGGAVKRSGALPGDVLVACGWVGDGWLGLAAAEGEIADPQGVLAARWRAPTPLFALREALRARAHAAADVSDGLIADAGHIAEASGVGLDLDLAATPLSPEARRWLAAQSDANAALLTLAAGGDDYGLVVAVAAADAEALLSEARAAGAASAAIGAFRREAGIVVRVGGLEVTPPSSGWRHR